MAARLGASSGWRTGRVSLAMCHAPSALVLDRAAARSARPAWWFPTGGVSIPARRAPSWMVACVGSATIRAGPVGGRSFPSAHPAWRGASCMRACVGPNVRRGSRRMPGRAFAKPVRSIARCAPARGPLGSVLSARLGLCAWGPGVCLASARVALARMTARPACRVTPLTWMIRRTYRRAAVRSPPRASPRVRLFFFFFSFFLPPVFPLLVPGIR